MPRIGAATRLAIGVVLAATSSAASPASVRGKLEWVSCDAITGWAQDSSDPNAALALELTFDAPLGGQADGAFSANVERDDLCAALGSCQHGFDVAPPFSLFDGDPHPVYAYAEDAAGSGVAQLSQSPATLVCAPPEVGGMKRGVSSAATRINWRFDLFWQGVAVDDAAVDAILDGPALPEAPVLARADDGSPEIWLLDGDLKRAVGDSATLQHWRFDSAAIETRAKSELDALQTGPPLRSRPMLVQTSLDELYLIDAELPLTASDGSEPDPTPAPAPPPAFHASPKAACSVSFGRKGGETGAGWLLALSVGFVLLRRRH